MLTSVIHADIEPRDTVTTQQLPQLMELFASAWWTANRSPEDVRQMLAASNVVVALADRRSDRLLAFARVLTDFTYVALIVDVIVATEARGSGLGAMLMDIIVDHPRLRSVHSLELVCQPGLMPFYHRWGFTEHVGQSRLMRRTSDPLPTPRAY